MSKTEKPEPIKNPIESEIIQKSKELGAWYYVVRIAIIGIIVIAIVMVISTNKSESQGVMLPPTQIVDAIGFQDGGTAVAYLSSDWLDIRYDFRDGGFLEQYFQVYEEPLDSIMIVAGDRVYVYLLYENFGLQRYQLDLPESAVQAGYVYLGEKLLVPILEK